MDITTVTTLMLIVVSPTKEVTPIDLPIYMATHAECVEYLSKPLPLLEEGWSANYSCITETGTFEELPVADATGTILDEDG